MHQQTNIENSPLRKIRVGRFQISIWRFKKLLSNGGKESTAYIEQWIDVDRACIQYSTKNRTTGQWENQSIWCPAEELRCLASVVDQFNKIEGGDEQSPPQITDGFSPTL
jgi:hypothetical protein